MLLGVLGGVTTALADGANRTATAYPHFVRAKKAADLVIAGKSAFGLVGSVDLDQVDALPGVAQSARAFAVFPFSATSGSRTFGIGDIFPVASTDNELGASVEGWKMLVGRRADPTKADEAVASRELVHRLGLHVGNTLHFHFYDAAHFGDTALALLQAWPRRLDAVARAAHVAGTDAADGPSLDIRIVGIEASPLEFPPLINDLAPVLHLTPAFDRRYGAAVVGSPVSYVRLRQPDALPSFELDVERLAHGNPVSIVSTLANQQPKVQRSIRAEAFVLAIVAGLVGLAAAIALAQAMARQAERDAGDNETFRALGMTRRDLFTIAMARTAFIALVAGAVTCLVAWLFAPSILLSLAREANLQHGFPVEPLALVCGGLAVAAFALLVGTLAGLLTSRRRRARSVETRTRRVANDFARGFAPVPMVLGVRNASRRRAGAAPAWTAIAGVAFAVATLSFAFTFTAHLQRGLTQKHRYGWNWDVKIGAPALPDIVGPIVPAMRVQPGITDLSVGAVTQINVGLTRVDVLGLDPVIGDAVPTLLAGHAPQSPREIVLGTRSMRTMRARVGGTVTANVGTTSAEYTVVGRAVFPEFGDTGQLGTGSWMTVAGVRRLLPSAPRDDFYVRYAPTADRNTRVEELAALMQPLPSRDDARPEDLANLARGGGLMFMLAVLLTVLSVAVLVHALVTSVRTSRGFHATLRAIGLTRSQSGATVVSHAFLLAGGAALIGIPVGMASGRVAWSAYADNLGVATDTFTPMSVVLLGLGVVVGAAIVAAIVPGWLAARAGRAVDLRAAE
jgi:ABC-type lipoprotein release transport system permease subunit